MINVLTHAQFTGSTLKNVESIFLVCYAMEKIEVLDLPHFLSINAYK